jgi:hypothetical protein
MRQTRGFSLGALVFVIAATAMFAGTSAQAETARHHKATHFAARAHSVSHRQYRAHGAGPASAYGAIPGGGPGFASPSYPGYGYGYGDNSHSYTN